MIESRLVGSVAVLHVRGRLTAEAGLRGVIDRAFQSGSGVVVLNLKEVSGIDSSGFAELIACEMHGARRGGRVVICSPSPRAREVFVVTQLNTVFNIYDTEPQALAACNPHEGGPMSEENKAIVRRIVEDHWNQKNRALIDELFATTCALHTPDGAFHGQDGARLLYDAYAAAFPDFKLRSNDVIADSDKVAVRYTFTGTHEGPLAGVPASGKQADVEGIVIFRLAGGRAEEVRFVWDKFALLQQIGALPAAGV